MPNHISLKHKILGKLSTNPNIWRQYAKRMQKQYNTISTKACKNKTNSRTLYLKKCFNKQGSHLVFLTLKLMLWEVAYLIVVNIKMVTINILTRTMAWLMSVAVFSEELSSIHSISYWTPMGLSVGEQTSNHYPSLLCWVQLS